MCNNRCLCKNGSGQKDIICLFEPVSYTCDGASDCLKGAVKLHVINLSTMTIIKLKYSK